MLKKSVSDGFRKYLIERFVDSLKYLSLFSLNMDYRFCMSLCFYLKIPNIAKMLLKCYLVLLPHWLFNQFRFISHFEKNRPLYIILSKRVLKCVRISLRNQLTAL